MNIVLDLSKEFHPVPKPEKTEKKKITAIKGKKHRTTKEKEIPMKIKKIVYERDKHKCIFCNKEVEIKDACCHFIPRSAGGLGIEQNIFTACEECHREQDNRLKHKKIR